MNLTELQMPFTLTSSLWKHINPHVGPEIHINRPHNKLINLYD